MDEKVIYSCVDREHNAWNCRGCGYIETFEADGPVENGWNFCPGCGHEIEVEAISPCRSPVQQRSELLGLPLRGKTCARHPSLHGLRRRHHPVHSELDAPSMREGRYLSACVAHTYIN